jgi:sarcosine oxidase subunit delta
MFLITCPYCGPRDEHEFGYGHEAHIARPTLDQQGSMTDAEWAEYLFLRKNPKGVHFERWVHTKGCRRSTVTHEIKAIYKMGEPAPHIDGETK